MNPIWVSYVYLHINALGKGMDPSLLPPAMIDWVLLFWMATSLPKKVMVAYCENSLAKTMMNWKERWSPKCSSCISPKEGGNFRVYVSK